MTSNDRYVALFDELAGGGDTLSADQLWVGIRKMKLPVMRCQVRQLIQETDLSQRGYVTRVRDANRNTGTARLWTPPLRSSRLQSH